MTSQVAGNAQSLPAHPQREGRTTRHHSQRGGHPHVQGHARGSPRGAFSGHGASRPPRRSEAHQEQPAPQPPKPAPDHAVKSVPALPIEPLDYTLGIPPPHILGTRDGARILCVAEIRGQISLLNKLAAENNVQAIIHTGDFGFYETESFERISDRTLRHVVQHSPLIAPPLRSRLLTADVPGSRGGSTQTNTAIPLASTPCREMRSQILAHPDAPLISEFPKLLSGDLKLSIPVYAVWGACEDVRVLEKLQTKTYAIHNLHILSEASSHAIEVGELRLRLFGLGGAVVMHKLFDIGEGEGTIAGGQGTMWTTLLQIGELVDTAQKTFDPAETRILVTHASPGREGLLMQLALSLRADFTISAGLHFRYGVSYNEFCVQNDTESLRRKFLQSKAAFNEVWESVRAQLDSELDSDQRILLNNALAVTNRVPNVATATGAVYEEPVWKNTWNWNLPDASCGHIVLDIRKGLVSSEIKSQGFNFAHRRALASETIAASTIQRTHNDNAVTAGARPELGQPAATRPASHVSATARQPIVHRETRNDITPSQQQANAQPQPQANAQTGLHVPSDKAHPPRGPRQPQQVNGAGTARDSTASIEKRDARILAPKGKKHREDKRLADRIGEPIAPVREAKMNVVKAVEDSAPATATADTKQGADVVASAVEKLTISDRNHVNTETKTKRGAKKTKSVDGKMPSVIKGDKTGADAPAKAEKPLTDAKAEPAGVAPAKPSAAAAAAPPAATLQKDNTAAKSRPPAADVPTLSSESAAIEGPSADGDKGTGPKSFRGSGRGRGGRGGGRGRGRGGPPSRGGATSARGAGLVSKTATSSPAPAAATGSG